MDKILKFFWRKLNDLSDASPTFHYVYANFLRQFDKAVNYFYSRKSFESVRHFNCAVAPLAEREVLDIVTVAFNQPDVIECQLKFLRKNLQDKFIYTVADNSLDGAAAAAIEGICGKYGVGYIRLPKNIYNNRLANWSHGLALNWAYRNFILPRGAAYFAFLDHDIFPVEPVAIAPILKQHLVYGAVHTRGSWDFSTGRLAPSRDNRRYWYLWPGFCFFRAEIFKNRRVNFTAVGIVTWHSHVSFDTGGGNWQDIYSKMDRRQAKEAHYRYALLNNFPAPQRPFDWLEGKETVHRDYDNKNYGTSDNFIEFIDNWLHLRRIGYGNPEAVKDKLNRLLFYFNQ